METFKWYTDAGLATEFSGTFLPTGTAHDYILYFGSNTASRQVQAASDPGVDQIALSIVDANSGTGHPATDVKLATTLLGLDSATAGAGLNLGATLTSAAATTVFVRLTDSTGGAAGVDTDLSITMNSIIETAT